ncbi:unnamed protein product, partial [Owenia fusiformis]
IYGLQNDESGPLNDGQMHDLTSAVYRACTEVGFLYLKNHGIDLQQVEKVRSVSKAFFLLPEETKKRYARVDGNNFGYIAKEVERLNPEREAGDLKEAFNISPNIAKKWPEEEIPGFKDEAMTLFNQCNKLSMRILEVMAIGLKLDRDAFTKYHTPNNICGTTMRSLYYNPLPEDFIPKADQVRCGEHSDYGSITLLFQDDVGGLEVADRSGRYMAATPIDGTIVVNIGDLMQRWTSDTFISTKHRVLIPKEELHKKEKMARQSIAFFVHPEEDAMISCIDGSEKYEQITAGDYLQMRFKDSYGDKNKKSRVTWK